MVKHTAEAERHLNLLHQCAWTNKEMYPHLCSHIFWWSDITHKCVFRHSR